MEVRENVIIDIDTALSQHDQELKSVIVAYRDVTYRDWDCWMAGFLLKLSYQSNPGTES